MRTLRKRTRSQNSSEELDTVASPVSSPLPLPLPSPTPVLRTPTKKARATPRKDAIQEPSPSPRKPIEVLKRKVDIPEVVSPHKTARTALHVATVPDSLPCRGKEFSQIFITLEAAITSATGCCIYISGTPGTGKTATVREAVAQLQLRNEKGEMADFTFLEINGMKLANSHAAYEILWEEISGTKQSAKVSMEKLERAFKVDDPSRAPIVVLLDELDQMITANQGIMYNFFNWPSFANSKLIVVAVSNTMDLPERILANKISSRLGLARIQFAGYNYSQLREIMEARLSEYTSLELIDKDALELVARKVAGVNGDARRALDLCRRAVEIAELENNGKGSRITMTHIKKVITEFGTSPVSTYIKWLPVASKIFLCAIIALIRRTSLAEQSLGIIMEECTKLIKTSNNPDRLRAVLFGNKLRMQGFLNALNELTEGGLLIQQVMKGERSANVRLTLGADEIKHSLKGDPDVAGML